MAVGILDICDLYLYDVSAKAPCLVMTGHILMPEYFVQSALFPWCFGIAIRCEDCSRGPIPEIELSHYREA